MVGLWAGGRGVSEAMFDYPIEVPSSTEYTRLGIDPEATSQEVSEAKAEFVARITTRQREVTQTLEDVYARVEGLRDAVRAFKELDSSGKGGTDRTRVVRRLREFERRAQEVQPRYNALRKETEELAREREEVNSLGVVQSPAEREAYDRLHPPLHLLKLEDARRDAFARDRRLMLPIVRRHVSQFLEDHGEPVHHPSDLTRSDFTADFSHNPLLDGPVEQR